MFVLFGVTSLAQSPSTTTLEIYRALLAEPSCSGRGKVPGRDRLVIHRATENFATSWWRPRESEVSWRAQIHRWFPELTETELEQFLRVNSGSQDIGNQVIADLGAVPTDDRTLRSLDRPGWIWDNFYRRYPNSTGYIQLSALAVEPGQQRVLAYCGLIYNSLGGEGHFFFVGSSPTGWHVISKQRLWES